LREAMSPLFPAGIRHGAPGDRGLVSGRLGRANAATILGVYAHFVQESDREAATMLGALLAPTRSKAN
jgi:hypothetical protein